MELEYSLGIGTVVTCESSLPEKLPVVFKSPVSWVIYFLKIGTLGVLAFAVTPREFRVRQSRSIHVWALGC